jgi:hypothetical protein
MQSSFTSICNFAAHLNFLSIVDPWQWKQGRSFSCCRLCVSWFIIHPTIRRSPLVDQLIRIMFLCFSRDVTNWRGSLSLSFPMFSIIPIGLEKHHISIPTFFLSCNLVTIQSPPINSKNCSFFQIKKKLSALFQVYSYLLHLSLSLFSET